MNVGDRKSENHLVLSVHVDMCACRYKDLGPVHLWIHTHTHTHTNYFKY